MEIIEKEISHPRLTINPSDNRVTLKFPNKYEKELKDRLISFSEKIVDEVINKIKPEYTQRGRFKLLDCKFRIHLHSEHIHKKKKSKTYLKEMIEE